MVGYDGDQDPYRAYQPRNFDTVNLPSPIRGSAPPTSTFDMPPVRGVAPSAPPTSTFDVPPVREGTPGGRASALPITTDYGEPPLRLRASEPPLTSRYEGVGPGERPFARRQLSGDDDFGGAPPVKEGFPGESRGGGGSGGGQTPIIDGTSSRETGYSPLAIGMADLLLRALTCICLVIALALFAFFLSDLKKYTTGFSIASPKYSLIATVIGLLYSLTQLMFAIFHISMGKTILPLDVSHYISYIGDQVSLVLFLSAGTATASYIIALNCTEGKQCRRGAAGVAMEFLAFALIAINSFLSTFSFYKKRN